MKLSTHRDDCGYRRDAQDFVVTLNGVRVPPRDLIMADDQSGIVVTFKRNGNGKAVTSQGDPVTVIRKGQVTIALPMAPEEVPFS